MGVLQIFAVIHTLAIMGASTSEKCRYLENLHQQYSSASLNPAQQALKRRLLTWYSHNCNGRK